MQEKFKTNLENPQKTLSEFFDLLVNGINAACIKDQKNENKIMWLSTQLPRCLRKEQYKACDGKSLDEQIEIRLNYIRENDVACFLFLINHCLLNELKDELQGMHMQPDQMNVLLAKTLASVMPNFEGVEDYLKKILAQSLFLSQNIISLLQAQVAPTCQAVVTALGEQAHEEEVATILKDLLVEEFSHIFEPLTILANGEAFKVEAADRADDSALLSLYEDNKSSIETLAKIKLSYSICGPGIIKAWDHFREIVNQSSWDFDSNDIKENLIQLLLRLYDLDATLAMILPPEDQKRNDLMEIVRTHLWSFLKKEQADTTLSVIDNYPDFFNHLLAFFYQVTEGEIALFKPLDLLNSINDYPRNLASVACALLLPLISNNAPDNKAIDPGLIDVPEEKKNIYAVAFIGVLESKLSQSEAIISSITDSVTTEMQLVKDVAGKGSTTVDESLLRTDDKQEMKYQELNDQAAYRYRIAKQKYVIDKEETELLRKAIRPLKLFSKLVPKLSADDEKVNEQSPENQQIVSYEEFLTEITGRIAKLESENAAYGGRRIGIDKHRIDHLKLAASFVEYLSHKYDQATHPEKRFQMGQRRGDKATYKDFIARLKIVKKPLDNKNASFAPIFAEAGGKLSYIYSENRALKDLHAHYSKRVEHLNNMKEVTMRLPSKHIGGFNIGATEDWGQVKNACHRANMETLTKTGAFFQLDYLSTLNTEKSQYIGIVTNQSSICDADAKYRLAIQDFLACSQLENFDPYNDDAMYQIGDMIKKLREMKKDVKQCAAHYAELLIGHTNTIKMLKEILDSIGASQDFHQGNDPGAVLQNLLNQEISKLSNAAFYLSSQQGQSGETTKILARSDGVKAYLQEIKTVDQFNQLRIDINQALPALQSHQKYELARIRRVTQETKIACEGIRYMMEHGTNSLMLPINRFLGGV